MINTLYYGDNLEILRNREYNSLRRPCCATRLRQKPMLRGTGSGASLRFRDFQGKFYKIIIEVKGGGYTPTMVRSLKAAMDAQNAPLGVFIALKPPTKGELSYAASLGTWQMPDSEHKYPVLQFMTIEDYFAGKRPDLPDTSGTLKKAKRIKKASEEKPELGI